MKENLNPLAKKANVPERVVVVVLSILLFAGSAVLYARDSRPLAAITVEKEGVSRKLTLSQVEEELKEAGKISINSATAKEITLIPGIGPAIASRIVEYRERHGKFHDIDFLLEVKGIGPSKLEKMKECVNVN